MSVNPQKPAKNSRWAKSVAELVGATSSEGLLVFVDLRVAKLFVDEQRIGHEVSR